MCEVLKVSRVRILQILKNLRSAQEKLKTPRQKQKSRKSITTAEKHTVYLVFWQCYQGKTSQSQSVGARI